MFKVEIFQKKLKKSKLKNCLKSRKNENTKEHKKVGRKWKK
jgi:hypothetical protein